MFSYGNKEHTVYLPRAVRCPHCGNKITEMKVIMGRVEYHTLKKMLVKTYLCSSCDSILNCEEWKN